MGCCFPLGCCSALGCFHCLKWPHLVAYRLRYSHVLTSSHSKHRQAPPLNWSRVIVFIRQTLYIFRRVRRSLFPCIPRAGSNRKGIFSAVRVASLFRLCWRTFRPYTPTIGRGLGTSQRHFLAIPRLVLGYRLEMVSPLFHRLAVVAIHAKLGNSLSSAQMSWQGGASGCSHCSSSAFQ